MVVSPMERVAPAKISSATVQHEGHRWRNGAAGHDRQGGQHAIPDQDGPETETAQDRARQRLDPHVADEEGQDQEARSERVEPETDLEHEGQQEWHGPDRDPEQRSPEDAAHEARHRETVERQDRDGVACHVTKGEPPEAEAREHQPQHYGPIDGLAAQELDGREREQHREPGQDKAEQIEAAARGRRAWPAPRTRPAGGPRRRVAR